jgi:putative Mg2+ transporter-C (MgtC) family protein
MDRIWPYLSNLHEALPPPMAGVVIILASMACGMIMGWERKTRHKPVGVRTLMLICVGSTIFTLASILIARDDGGDRGRIAAQVVSGIGFLGAGAIIRDRGTVHGLTTGATIWTVAAIGVLNGTGYVVAGVVLTLMVVGCLIFLRDREGEEEQDR